MMRWLWKSKNFLFSFLRIKTVGARALVIKNHKVLLVKHTYLPGWCTIGGGVNRGESPLQAVQRELIEEAGIHCTKPPRLFNVYFNVYEKRDDYISFYIVEHFTEEQRPPSTEIAEVAWFPLKELPEEISPSTHRRIEEYLGKRPVSDRW